MVKITKTPTRENEREEVLVTLLSNTVKSHVSFKAKFLCTTAEHLASLEEINT